MYVYVCIILVFVCVYIICMCVRMYDVCIIHVCLYVCIICMCVCMYYMTYICMYVWLYVHMYCVCNMCIIRTYVSELHTWHCVLCNVIHYMCCMHVYIPTSLMQTKYLLKALLIPGVFLLNQLDVCACVHAQTVGVWARSRKQEVWL